MAEKGFGVKEINLIGASGTPTIESPNNLNLNAVNVAISTNATIGGNLTVSGTVGIAGTLTYEDVTNVDSIGILTARTGVKVLAGGINVVGVSYFNNNIVATATTALSVTAADESSDTSCNVLFSTAATGNVAPKTGSNLTFNSSNGTLSATTFSGSGESLTGIAVTEAPVTDYTISANGSSAYRFHGGGVDETSNNPDLYLIRGQKYRFNNTTGSGHPFAIRVSNGGSAYTDGVSGNNQGVQFFTVPLDAPASLVYQCTIHSGMVGNIYIRGGSSTANISNNADNRVITGGSGGNLNGESTLTYDGTTLGNSVGGLNLQSAGGDLINVTSTNATNRSTIKFNTNGNDWEIGARGSSGNPDNSFYFYDNASTAYRMVINPTGFITNTFKPVRTAQNAVVTQTTNERFVITLPSTSRMFRLTGSFNFDGSGTGTIWADFGDWSDSHSPNLEGFSNVWRDAAGGPQYQDNVSGRYYRVATPFDYATLEVTYDVLITTKAFNGGVRPGAHGHIRWTWNGIGNALTVFSFQDTAASGTDRLNSFAWDIDGVSGSPGTGRHHYIIEEYPLT